jgi:hypothetical protein
MVTSSAYRQSSVVSVGQAAARQIDPDNRLLWRQRLRRLEAEPLRDAVLAVSGTLNGQMHGPPVPVVGRADGEVAAPDSPDGQRRSIYMLVRRSQPLTILQVFDQPRMETNCTRRPASTVSSQALTLLNSDFLVRQADSFAARVEREQPSDPAAHAVFLAFGRPATAAEKQALQGFLQAQAARHAAAAPDKTEADRRALADLCHMLFGANEFEYVD